MSEPETKGDPNPVLDIENESCRYTYTQAELLELGRKMARSRDQIDELDGELETFKAQHKFKLKAAEEEEGLNRSRFMAGYEMRPTQLLILRFRPDKDSALVIRLDTGRVHDKRKLLPHEKPGPLFTTTTEPEQYIFVADFWSDSEPTVLEYEGVPLIREEAEKVKDLTTLRPMRKQLGSGKGAGSK